VRILVVEDDETIATLLGDLLRSEGYQPVRTRTRDEALAEVVVGVWRAIVADGTGQSYLEPDDDDRVFFATLARHAPVVITTARSWAQTVPPAELRVTAVLAKPYDVDELLDLLKGL
jgi:DNA-binding response OmpR family regulator